MIAPHLARLHYANARIDSLPELLLANLPSAGAKARSSSSRAGSVPASIIQGSEPDLPASSINGLPIDLPTPGPSNIPDIGQVSINQPFSGEPTSGMFSPNFDETFDPPTGAGGANLDVGGGANYGAPAPAIDYPVPGQGAEPSFPVDQRNLGPVQSEAPSRLPGMIGGTLGSIAGTAAFGPLGGLGGRLLGTYIANILAGNVPARRYDPTAPISLSNIPPATAQQSNFPLPGGGGHVAYQQSGSIMDSTRPGALRGVDPSAALFTNSIQPYGPGRPAYTDPNGNVHAGNESPGYLGAGIAQADLLAMAKEHMLKVDAAPSEHVLSTSLPNTPFFQALAARNAAAMPLPPMGAAPLSTLLGLPPPPAPVPPGP